MVLSTRLNDWIDAVLKAIGDIFAAFLFFLLFVFILGEFWALYFMRSGNEFFLWLPVGILLIILFVKAVD
jgi:hypothetical protein